MAKKNIAANLRKRNLQNSKNSAVLKKGMELPINTLVVVAIAVIVILAIAAFFMGGFGGSSKDIQNRQAFMNVCSSWTQTGCADNDMPYDLEERYATWQPSKSVDGAGKALDTNTLGGLTITDYLKKMCGCFGTGTPNPTSTPSGNKACSSYTAANCPTSQGCEAKNNACVAKSTTPPTTTTIAPPPIKCEQQSELGCRNVPDYCKWESGACKTK